MYTTTRKEDIMTDYQFKTVLKMARSVVDKSSSIDEARQSLDALIGEKPVTQKKTSTTKK
jgi:hypothetical protein